jgi:hypothetical protein
MRLRFVSTLPQRREKTWGQVRRGVNILENKIISIARRRCQNRDDSHEPMFKQTSQRRVEGLATAPEPGEWQDALTTELLHQTALREDDTQDVTKGGESDEDRQSALGTFAKHVSEKGGSNEALGGENLLLGHTGKVGNVDEHIQDRDGADGEGRSDLECADGVLHLAHGVVGVGVSDVTPDDVVQRRHDAIGTSSGALERVGEVLGGVLEVDQRRNDDDENNAELDNSEHILQPQSPFQSSTVNQEGDGDTSETQTSGIPLARLNPRRKKDVLAKHDRISCSPAKKNNIAGVQRGSEEPRLAEDILENILLASVSGNCRTKLHIDGSTSGGDEPTDKPHNQGETDGTAERENTAGRGEDTGADDTVEDEKRSSGDADGALGLTGSREGT